MLSDRFSVAIVNKLRADGKDVPCRKGCSACCRYLVPLSVPEAFRLREDISLLPVEQGKATLQACLETAGKILEKSPDDFASTQSHGTNDPEQTGRIGGWYAGLDLPCPFLSEDACISYQRRPIACREHLVTDSAALCAGGETCEPSVVPMPVSVLECLGRLAAELEQSDVEAVMLPLALPWALKNHDRSQRTWPTAEMVQRFVETFKAEAKKTQTCAEVHI
jgi:Fe-S-cluster containining protein